MSYRDDLKAFAKERSKLIKTVILAVKITAVILALSLVATTVALIVDVASASGSSGKGGSGGVGGSSNSSPVISLVGGGDTIYVYAGENISWRKYVQATDDEDGALTPQIESNVNLDKEGIYTVTFSATDSSGKKTQKTVTVHVTKKEYSYSVLMDTVKAKAEQLGITKSMSKKEQVKAIYAFVNDQKNISYSRLSNVPDVDRSKWEEDWVEEATLTLRDKEGDCYSYYSVSKAFFEYFDIEHVGIQRDNSNIPSKEGTHFWLVVNIGEKTDEWYYYDATRLKGTFDTDGTNNACLITLKKIQSYNPGDPLDYDFYTFDPSKYPTVSTKELT